MKTYLVFEDEGCVWPNPLDPDEIGWKLCYGKPTETELLQASAFISAYRHLCLATQKDSLHRLKMIRKKLREGEVV
jgi:hypothetical protein